MRIACVFLMLCSTPSAAEVIRPDLSNVRGLDYIASYAPSDVVMWRFCDREVIDRELKPVRAFAALAGRQGVQASEDFAVNPDGPGFPIVGEKEVADLILHWDEPEIGPESSRVRETHRIGCTHQQRNGAFHAPYLTNAA